MNVQMLVCTELLCIIQILKLFFLTVLDLNMFLKKLKKIIGHENIKTNILRIQASNSIMCGYFCIGLIYFMLAGKTFIDYTNLFPLYDFIKNDKDKKKLLKITINKKKKHNKLVMLAKKLN